MKNSKLQDLLNSILASESILAVKTRNAHWNLTSTAFKPLHEWLGDLYSETNSAIDEIAERNKMIGGRAIGSMKEYLKISIIEDEKGILENERKILSQLTEDHMKIAELLKKGIRLAEKADDPGTEDFLTGLLQTHEKTIWFLKSHNVK